MHTEEPQLNIAIFASGSGSNAEAILQSIKSGQLKACVPLIISDKPQAGVLDRARSHSIEGHALSPSSFETTEIYLDALYALFAEHATVTGSAFEKSVGRPRWMIRSIARFGPAR